MSAARKAELVEMAKELYLAIHLQSNSAIIVEKITKHLQAVGREVWLAAAQHASMQVVYAVDDKKLKDFADWCRTQAKETTL